MNIKRRITVTHTNLSHFIKNQQNNVLIKNLQIKIALRYHNAFLCTKICRSVITTLNA